MYKYLLDTSQEKSKVYCFKTQHAMPCHMTPISEVDAITLYCEQRQAFEFSHLAKVQIESQMGFCFDAPLEIKPVLYSIYEWFDYENGEVSHVPIYQEYDLKKLTERMEDNLAIKASESVEYGDFEEVFVLGTFNPITEQETFEDITIKYTSERDYYDGGASDYYGSR